MTDTIQMTPVSVGADGVVSYEPSWSTRVDVKMARRVATSKRILFLIVLCATVCYVAATAQAQELFSPNLTPTATGMTTGRWSLETPETAIAPSLQVSMVQPQFRPSDSLHASSAQLSGNRPTEPTINSSVNLASFGLGTEAQQAKSASFAYADSLHPESFLSFVQTKFMLRESSLADSESLTSVNAVSAYPLLEINYAGWHLPVTLFNSSSRTNDARW